MGKGVVNNKMSNYVFGLLEKDGVPTHFIKELSVSFAENQNK